MALTRTNDDIEKRGVKEELSEKESVIIPARAMENEQLDDMARDLKFLSEPVEIMILPSSDPNDTTRLVDISVNGKTFWFMRGEWRKAPRYVLEILATARSEAWDFGYKVNPAGVTTQTQTSSHLLRFPHQFRDTDPKGLAWYDSIKNMVK